MLHGGVTTEPPSAISLERLVALEERIRQLEATALTKKRRLGLLSHEDPDDSENSVGSDHQDDVEGKDLESLEIDGNSSAPSEKVAVVLKEMIRSSETSPYKESKPRGLGNNRRPPDKEEPAMIFTSYFKIDEKDSRNKISEKVSAELKSPVLVDIMRAAMKNTLEHGHTLSAWEKLPVILDTRSDILTHCIDDLHMAAANAEGDDRAKKELSCFLHHFSVLHGDRVKIREMARKQQEVAFGHLWTLFPAGCEVVAKPFQEAEQIMKVQRYYESERKVFTVICWCYDWDGKGVVQRFYEFIVLKYERLKPLFGLPCYPLELYDQKEKGKSEVELREALVTRGKLFRDYCVPRQVEEVPGLYRTPKIVLRSDRDIETEMFERMQLARNPELSRKSPVEEIAAESGDGFDIVLDASRCQQYSSSTFQLLGDYVTTRRETPCECPLCDPDARQASFLKHFMARDGQGQEHDALYALLPPRLHAYDIARKSWGQVHVNDIVAEKFNEKRDWDNPWKQLVLNDSHKQNIEALVTSHFTRVSKSDAKQDSGVNIQDLVRRKGDGVVILLHGELA
jgi:hypothetical protein